jgi:glutathione synthase/RimK-type ligase-like ATP-grasp enzyme
LPLYFITQAERGYIEDDRLLVPAIERLGIRPIQLPWTDGLDKVTAKDTLVIRAIWDYHLRPNNFTNWLHSASRIGCRLINPEPLLRWNHKKTYLREMAAKGICVPQTFFFASPDDFAARTPQLSPQTEYVIKPSISASAHGTFRVPADAISKTVAGFPYEAFVVQEFLPEISQGEWSLIFLGGEFSHAVKKVPQEGEFRIQSEFGGRVLGGKPPYPAIREAKRTVGLLPQQPIYARIDLIMRGEIPLLIEIELIEPDLFLSTHPPAAERLAGLIATGL